MTERHSASGNVAVWAMTFAIGVGTLAVCLLLWRQGISNGKALVGAGRVLDGEIPYRDFWTMYAPGHYYLLAVLFALFGKQVMTSTVAAAVLSGMGAASVFRLGLVLVGRMLPACLLAAMFVAALVSSGYHRSLGSYPPAILLIVVGLISFAHGLRRRSLKYLAAAGASVGLAAVFKYDIAAYACAAMVVGLLVYHLMLPPPVGGRLRAAIRDAAATTAAASLPVLFVVAVLAPVAGPEMFDQLIRFPAMDFKYTRGEWYPRWFPRLEPGLGPRQVLLRLGDQVPFALATLVWVGAVISLLAKSPRKFPLRTALGTTFAALWLMHHAAAHVQVNTHVMSLTLYAGALGLLALDALGVWSGSRRRWLGAVAVTVAVIWTSLLAALPAEHLLWRMSIRDRLAPLSGATTAGALFFAVDVERIERLRQLVRENTRPGEPIFVGEHRHDIVIINNPSFYFLLDRPVVGRYHELHPGVADTEPAQQEIIAALERAQTPLLLLFNTFDDEELERALDAHRKNLPEVGATALDSYITSNYEVLERHDRWAVWVRKPTNEKP